jgi:hypothetical protein
MVVSMPISTRVGEPRYAGLAAGVRIETFGDVVRDTRRAGFGGEDHVEQKLGVGAGHRESFAPAGRGGNGSITFPRVALRSPRPAFGGWRVGLRFTRGYTPAPLWGDASVLLMM